MRTATANRLKQQASALYAHQDFLLASLKYKTLLNDLEIREEEVICNLAHCYFNLHDTLNARLQYEKLMASPEKKLKSIAFQQLGILAFERTEKENALSLTRQALQADPSNEKARFNYEWLRSRNIAEKSPETQPQPENKKQESQASAIPDASGSAEKTMRKPKNIELSEEKAKALLQAIQDEENRSTRQKRRFVYKKQYSDKPDW